MELTLIVLQQIAGEVAVIPLFVPAHIVGLSFRLGRQLRLDDVSTLFDVLQLAGEVAGAE